MNPRRLYRSQDHQLAGVAGGMAEYLDIDPTVVRILWIIAGLASAGLAIIAYVVLAIVIPQAPYAAGVAGPWATAPGASAPPAGAAWSSAPPAGAAWSSAPPAGAAWDTRWPSPPQPAATPRAEGRGVGIGAIAGVVLIVFGVVALADATIPGWVAGPVMGPALILALGAALLVASLRRRADASTASPTMPESTGAGAGTAFGPEASFAAAPGAPFAAAEPKAPTVSDTPWETTDTQAVDPGSQPA